MEAKKINFNISNIGLEQLFGSKTRVKLLKLFLNSADKFYFIREAARAVNAQINSVRRELMNLKKLGIIKEIQIPRTYFLAVRTHQNKLLKEFKKIRRQDVLKKFFQANSDFILFPELKALLLKADFLLEKNFVKSVERVGNVDYLALTGRFVGLSSIPIDLFLVGRFNRRRLARLIHHFEKEFGREINYTVMSRQEFKYRKDITDRFLYDILENKKIVMVNELGIK